MRTIVNLNTAAKTISINGELFGMETKAIQILQILLSNKNKLVERSHILREVWKNEDYFASRSMDVFICKVRKVLKSTNLSIENTHGKGFTLLAPANTVIQIKTEA